MPRAKVEILPGRQFYKLTIIEMLPHRAYVHDRYRCLCECGKKSTVVKYALLSGNTRSCGCWRVEVGRKLGKRQAKHGDAGTHWNGKSVMAAPEYRAWTSMIQRCTRETHEAYKDYGGRGIKVCKRWLKSYQNFLSDVGRRPSPQHSLDRRNNNKGYYPRNVHWATQAEQVRNSRVAIFLTHNGKTMCITDWATELGLKRDTIYLRRSKGWSVEDSLRPSLRARSTNEELVGA